MAKEAAKPVYTVEADTLSPTHVDSIIEHRRYSGILYIGLASSVAEQGGKARLRPEFRARMSMNFAVQLRDLLNQNIEEAARELAEMQQAPRN